MKFPFLIAVLIIFYSNVEAQHTDIFPSLSGTVLLDSLRSRFTPPLTLGYNIARDTLYRNILGRSGQLECVYTGYTIQLDQNLDPTEDAFNKGINTEHIYPQAKGAQNEPMRSNMYNLFPTLENVNNDRGNVPFGEINDQDTKWWYYMRTKQSTIPDVSVRDNYSEGKNDLFEPREARKGDIARSVFYFFTIYHDAAMNSDSNFFKIMVHDLCIWHYQDQISPEEWNVNQMIALYQDGRPNPFVSDCTLPERSYCAGLGYKCTPANANRISYRATPLMCYPSVLKAGESLRIKHSMPMQSLHILDGIGNVIIRQDVNASDSEINTKQLKSGTYFVYCVDGNLITGTGKFVVN